LRYIYLSFLFLCSVLKVDSQQLPEHFDYNTNYLRIANTQSNIDIKVFRGKLSADVLQSTTAIIGKVKYKDSYTSFTPLVPFDQETPYTVLFNEQVFVFEITRPDTEAALHVVEIYPNAEHVPANILKWYVQFSKPVNPVKIYEHIHFLDQHGKAIDRSILHLGAPLLSADGKLLTIWIEPGRQKRMLGPNQHLGSVFQSSKKYTLSIKNTLKDTQGNPIENPVEHSFTTQASDRVKPSVDTWNILPLVANSQKPLEIICEEHLDYGSLLDALSILHEGSPVRGQLSYLSATKTILFTPEKNWTKGTYNIHVEHLLEDLAGNNLVHLFDRPIQEGVQYDQPLAQILSFVCK